MNSKTFVRALLGVGALILVGCSSVPTRVNEGHIPAKTFSFMAPKGAGPAHFAERRAQVHALIQEAITHSLASKGVAKVDAGGDITVAYLVVVASNATTAAVSDYFGYGPDATEILQKAHKKAAEKREEALDRRMTDTRFFTPGALVIDVLDPKTAALLYRNFTARELLRNVPLDVRKERLQEAVDEVLGDLRIKPTP
jgi:hypothetical protein